MEFKTIQLLVTTILFLIIMGFVVNEYASFIQQSENPSLEVEKQIIAAESFPGRYAFSEVFFLKSEGIAGTSFESPSRHTVIECNEFSLCCSREGEIGCIKPIDWDERRVVFNQNLRVPFAARCKDDSIFTCRLFFGSEPGQLFLEKAEISTSFIDLKERDTLSIVFTASNIGKQPIVSTQAFVRVLKKFTEFGVKKIQLVKEIAIEDFSLEVGEQQNRAIFVDFEENGIYELELVLQERNDITDFSIEKFEVEVIGAKQIDLCTAVSVHPNRGDGGFCKTTLKCANCKSANSCIEKWKIKDSELIGKSFQIVSDNEFWVEGLPNNESCEVPLLNFCEQTCSSFSTREEVDDDLLVVSFGLNVSELNRNYISVGEYSIDLENRLFHEWGCAFWESCPPTPRDRVLVLSEKGFLQYLFYKPSSDSSIFESHYFKIKPGFEIKVGGAGFFTSEDFEKLAIDAINGEETPLEEISYERLTYAQFYGMFEKPFKPLLENNLDVIGDFYFNVVDSFNINSPYQLLSLDNDNVLFFWNNVSKRINTIAWKKSFPEGKEDFRSLDFTQGPCIPPAVIKDTLERNQSPAVNNAIDIYKKAKEHGIDPAVGMAFFEYFNNLGTSRVTPENSFGLIPFSLDAPFTCSSGLREGSFCRYESYENSIENFFTTLEAISITNGKELEDLVNAFNSSGYADLPKIEYAKMFSLVELYRGRCLETNKEKQGEFVLKGQFIPGSEELIFEPFSLNAAGLMQHHGMTTFNATAFSLKNNQFRIKVIPDNLKLYSLLKNDKIEFVQKQKELFDYTEKFCNASTFSQSCNSAISKNALKQQYFIFSKRMEEICSELKGNNVNQDILNDCIFFEEKLELIENNTIGTSVSIKEKVCKDEEEFGIISSNTTTSCNKSLSLLNQQLEVSRNFFYSLSTEICNSAFQINPEVQESIISCNKALQESKILSKFILDCNPYDPYRSPFNGDLSRACTTNPVLNKLPDIVAHFNQGIKEDVFNNACIDPNKDTSNSPVNCELREWDVAYQNNHEVIVSNENDDGKGLLLKYYIPQNGFKLTSDGFELKLKVSLKHGSNFTPYFSNQTDLDKYLESN